MNKFTDELIRHLRTFLEKVMSFIPDLLVLMIILAAGIITALVVRFLIIKFLGAMKFDSWSEKAGLSSVLEKAGIKISPLICISRFIFWLIIIVSFMAGFGSLGLEVTRALTSDFFLYLPKFISALIIISAGYIFAGFLGRSALLAAVNYGIEHSRLLGESVRIFILILVFAMALEQLSVAPRIVITAFLICFGGVALALALAFGLGGRETAKKIIEDFLKKRDKNNIDHL